MIAALRGTILHHDGDEVIVDVGGVGYGLSVSSAVLAEGIRVGADVELQVHTDVRENDIVLFGFQNVSEKQLFLLLKKVKGVGSRLALAIVSAVSPRELLSAIGNEDVTALKRVPGVGKKTAERLIVELREHVENTAKEAGVAPVRSSGRLAARVERTGDAASGIAEDVILALEKLGFSLSDAQRVVDETLEQAAANGKPIVDTGELLRATLAGM